MRWIRMQGKIPIADILGYGSNFSIQEKMRGLPVGLQWHSWSTDAKVRTDQSPLYVFEGH